MWNWLKTRAVAFHTFGANFPVKALVASFFITRTQVPDGFFSVPGKWHFIEVSILFQQKGYRLVSGTNHAAYFFPPQVDGILPLKPEFGDEEIASPFFGKVKQIPMNIRYRFYLGPFCQFAGMAGW